MIAGTMQLRATNNEARNWMKEKYERLNLNSIPNKSALLKRKYINYVQFLGKVGVK